MRRILHGVIICSAIALIALDVRDIISFDIPLGDTSYSIGPTALGIFLIVCALFGELFAPFVLLGGIGLLLLCLFQGDPGAELWTMAGVTTALGIVITLIAKTDK